MKYFLNTQTGILSPSGFTGQPLRRLEVKQRDDLIFEVIPDEPLDQSATGLFAAKVTYEGVVCAIDSHWDDPQESGAGYVFAVTLATSQVDTAIASAQGDVTLKSEIRWINLGKMRRTQTFDMVVSRAVYLDDEALPDPVTAPNQFFLSSPDGSTWGLAITNDGQIERTKIS